MTANSRVSVVIPTHEDRGFIQQTIASVLRNIEPCDEVLVVANGCSPAYSAKLRAMESTPVRLIESPIPCVARARNRGAQDAIGEFVLLLDDDDILRDGGLTALRIALAESGDSVAVVGNVDKLGDAGEGPCSRHPTGQGPYTMLNLVDGSIVSPGAGLIRRDALLRCGGFNPKFVPTEDFDVWLKLATLGSIFWINVSTLEYRVHAGSLSRQSSRMAWSAIRVFGAHVQAVRRDESARNVFWALRSKFVFYDAQLRRSFRPAIRSAQGRELVRLLRTYLVFGYHLGRLATVATTQRYVEWARKRISQSSGFTRG